MKTKLTPLKQLIHNSIRNLIRNSIFPIKNSCNFRINGQRIKNITSPIIQSDLTPSMIQYGLLWLTQSQKTYILQPQMKTKLTPLRYSVCGSIGNSVGDSIKDSLKSTIHHYDIWRSVGFSLNNPIWMSVRLPGHSAIISKELKELKEELTVFPQFTQFTQFTPQSIKTY